MWFKLSVQSTSWNVILRRYLSHFWTSGILKNDYSAAIKLQLRVNVIITRRISCAITRTKRRRAIARSTLGKNAIAHIRRDNRRKKGVSMTAQRKIGSSRRDGDQRVSFVKRRFLLYLVTTHTYIVNVIDILASLHANRISIDVLRERSAKRPWFVRSHVKIALDGFYW